MLRNGAKQKSCSASKMPYADFSSLVPNAFVRVTDDSLVYAIDVTMVFTQKNSDASSLVLRRLKEKSFSQVLEQPIILSG